MPSPEAVIGPGSRRIIRARPDGSGEIVVDHWLRLRDADPLPELDALPILVSLARLAAEGEALRARVGELGAWIPGDAEAEAAAPAVRELPLVAIEIAKFTDGRHFSLARLLRERFGFAGELRAVGDVLPDQLFYMRRCGYSSFELKPGKSLETGLRTLAAFSVSYQAGADAPPLFRRRFG